MLDSIKHWLGNVDLVAVAVYTVAVQLLGIAAALESIMKTRTAPGALAWSLSLVLMPTVMLPLYWIFGRRKFRGYAKARRIGARGSQPTRAALEHHKAAPLADYQPVLEQIAQMPFTRGNNVELLIDGQQIFDALYAAIDSAHDYILLQYYIVRDDTTGKVLRDRLLAKAQQGIAIYFLYDEIGSFQLGNAFIDSLREGGVAFRAFNSTKGWRNRWQLNFRNHRKIVVVDGAFGIVGGNNIGDEYLDGDPILTPWRDTSVAVRGPAVLSLQQSFVEDWYWACEQIPRLHWSTEQTAALGNDVLVMPTGPADHLETCQLFFQQLTQAAQRRLWIVSPYFVPDLGIINALQLAALRGVDVRILLPEKPDKRLVWFASFANLDEVQSTGIRVYRYHAGFLHQKVWLMDNDCAVIGTANLDNRSFRLNFEVGIVVHNRDFAMQVENMLARDFANSRLLQRKELTVRGFLFRLAVRCAYLLAPIL